MQALGLMAAQVGVPKDLVIGSKQPSVSVKVGSGGRLDWMLGRFGTQIQGWAVFIADSMQD